MLLTRPPLGIATSFDLHVLSTPPAFVLSQDQTLRKIISEPFEGSLLTLIFLTRAWCVRLAIQLSRSWSDFELVKPFNPSLTNSP